MSYKEEKICIFSDDKMIQIIKEIKNKYPECAITLSIGEKTRASYQKYFDAGADRYLLRHETANISHYQKLHPAKMDLNNRLNCLKILKRYWLSSGSWYDDWLAISNFS